MFNRKQRTILVVAAFTFGVAGLIALARSDRRGLRRRRVYTGG